MTLEVLTVPVEKTAVKANENAQRGESFEPRYRRVFRQ